METIKIASLTAISLVWLVVLAAALHTYANKHAKLLEILVSYALHGLLVTLLIFLAALFANLMHYLLA